MMRTITTSLLLAIVLSGIAHAAAPNMKEGLWEITTKMEMPGMPTGMPPQVMQQCFTGKDLEDPRKTAPGGPGDSSCQMTDYKMQGNTATWNMACKGEGAMTGSGSITYSGTSYAGTNRMTMTHGGSTQTMTMQYSGRHLGACKKP
jgi:Protein of unknown function (DUF3617)